MIWPPKADPIARVVKRYSSIRIARVIGIFRAVLAKSDEFSEQLRLIEHVF